MSISTFARALVAAALVSISAFAAAAPIPVNFTITGTSLTASSGYGLNNSDLDVVFTVAGIPLPFSLAQGESFQFQFASVNLRELCIDGPQSGCGNGGGNETTDLGVTAYFTFSSPVGNTISSIAVGSAWVGTVGDTFEDYRLVFDTVEVAFGTTGLFLIDLNDLHYSNIGTQLLNATVTLSAADVPADAPNNVPEPGSLALLGLGLLAFAARRRAAA